MSSHPRFVTFCQQMLVLGVICAVLTPAANVMSLDLVPRAPQGGGAVVPQASLAAYDRASRLVSSVPDAPVAAEVDEYSLTAPAGARVAPGSLKARARTVARGTELVSDALPVSGFGTVGVTWDGTSSVDEDGFAAAVRTRTDGAWSGWTPMTYHAEHGPDPTSPEGRRARPGTTELLVGEVDEVQVKVATTRSAPADMKLAVIDPGTPESTTRERGEIETGEGTGQSGTAQPSAATGLPSSAGDLQLAAAAFTPKPVIYSRKQWGADERLRDASSLRYFEVHAGFVHHTVNANGYKAKDVPSILRGIYAYHTQSRGWSDVGYNYLVDRFGRIWEGRAGGIDRPVVGAHTLGYNDHSFAMSAIGNFDVAQPSKAMVQAFGVLFGWKLSLHGVDAQAGKKRVGPGTFKAINGHRDAGSTACPGKYLYAKLPEIRRIAKEAQVGFGGRQLESDLFSTPQPDIVVRRKSDGQGFLIPIKKSANGSYKAGRPTPMAVNLASSNRVMNVGDWDRDGKSDIITRRARDGALYLRPGLGNGKFGAVKRIATGFRNVGMLAAVGDMTGDGWPDLMGQPRGGSMMIYPGNGPAGLKPAFPAYSRVTGMRQIGIGRWGGDGAPDTLVRKGPSLLVYDGNGPGGLTGGRGLGLDLRPFDWVVGVSDVDLTGHPDLILRSKGDGKLWLVRATAKSFAPPVLLGTGMGIYNMVS